LLTYVRHGDVAQVHSLRRGAAEALEIVARRSQDLEGRRPANRRVAADRRRLHRGHRPRSRPQPDVGYGLAKKKQKGRVLIAHKDVVIETGDHVIVFCLDKKVVKQVEKLFCVGFHFF
jgi:trk system potassium uptake protein TrkA